jgi:hypothetical protein
MGGLKEDLDVINKKIEGVRQEQEHAIKNLKDEVDFLRLLEDATQEQNMKFCKDEMDMLRHLVGVFQEQNNARFQKIQNTFQDYNKFVLSSILIVFLFAYGVA